MELQNDVIVTPVAVITVALKSRLQQPAYPQNAVAAVDSWGFHLYCTKIQNKTTFFLAVFLLLTSTMWPWQLLLRRTRKERKRWYYIFFTSLQIPLFSHVVCSGILPLTSHSWWAVQFVKSNQSQFRCYDCPVRPHKITVVWDHKLCGQISFLWGTKGHYVCS